MNGFSISRVRADFLTPMINYMDAKDSSVVTGIALFSLSILAASFMRGSGATKLKPSVTWPEESVVKKVILIETREELRKEGLMPELFWNLTDYGRFKSEAVQEIKDHQVVLQKNTIGGLVSLLDAMGDLYQPKAEDLITQLACIKKSKTVVEDLNKTLAK